MGSSSIQRLLTKHALHYLDDAVVALQRAEIIIGPGSLNYQKELKKVRKIQEQIKELSREVYKD